MANNLLKYVFGGDQRLLEETLRRFEDAPNVKRIDDPEAVQAGVGEAAAVLNKGARHEGERFARQHYDTPADTGLFEATVRADFVPASADLLPTWTAQAVPAAMPAEGASKARKRTRPQTDAALKAITAFVAKRKQSGEWPSEEEAQKGAIRGGIKNIAR